MQTRRLGATLIALGLLFGGAPLPGAAQDRPLGSEVEPGEAAARGGARGSQEALEAGVREMEVHARRMSEALTRAYSDSNGTRVYWREGALDSAQDRFLYRTSMRTPCARIGISFTGSDTIVVQEVMPGSGAEAAGMRAGDVILRVDGSPADARRMSAMSDGLEAGDRVRFAVLRGEREQTLEVTAREDVCPLRTMLSQVPFRVMCLSMDSADAEHEDGCDPELVYGLRDQLKTLHRMPLHIRSEATDSGTWLLRFGEPGSADSIFIDMDSVRMLTEAIAIQFDSLRRAIPFTIDMADSITRLMPTLRSDVEVEATHAHGVMLRSMALGARAVAGAELTELNPDLAAYFDVDAGVLVTKVEPNTPAARAGLQGGDVIVSVNGTDVEGLRDVRREVSDADGPIDLAVVRAGERRTVRITR